MSINFKILVISLLLSQNKDSLILFSIDKISKKKLEIVYKENFNSTIVKRYSFYDKKEKNAFLYEKFVFDSLEFEFRHLEKFKWSLIQKSYYRHKLLIGNKDIDIQKMFFINSYKDQGMVDVVPYFLKLFFNNHSYYFIALGTLSINTHYPACSYIVVKMKKKHIESICTTPLLYIDLASRVPDLSNYISDYNNDGIIDVLYIQDGFFGGPENVEVYSLKGDSCVLNNEYLTIYKTNRDILIDNNLFIDTIKSKWFFNIGKK